ncbi:MAG: glycoside hydrolase/phage tail family protein, partial [Brevundimonas sp.]
LAAEAGADGLIIGSELRGVTTLRDAGGGYPAVAELRALAAECRAIVGPDVALSYAADWSEYFGHHPGGGEVVFHLDPLWADPAVDHVAVDWYPPVGDWREGEDHLDAQAGHAGPADPAYLAANTAGGENFDWFYASDADRAAQVRTPITDGAYGEPWVWRSKDLKSWWSHAHHDRPGGVRSPAPTAWVPGMKPVRLTEFGCAAVDKGGNAPNLFPDPRSSESVLPPFSTGARDDLMQRRVMEAWLAHFDDDADNPVSAVYGGRMVEGLDAWCWDARPYPDFPARAAVWADAGNWRTGHWLNGRLAGEGRDLIAAILKRGGLDETDFGITGVETAVAGYVIDRPMRTRDALEPLLFALGAEGGERDGRVAVVGRREGVVSLSAEALAMPDDGSPVSAARVLETAPDTVRVRFIDETADYQAGSVTVRGPETGGGGLDMDLPAACSAGLAKAVAERALAASGETLTAHLGPLEALRLEPGDAVALEGRAGVWRVARIELDETPRAVLIPWAETTPEDGEIDWRTAPPGGGAGAPFLALLDLPPLPGAEDDGRPLAAVAGEPWRAMQVHGGADTDGLTARANVAAPATAGRL